MNRTPLTFLSIATFSTFALLSTSALSATKIGVVSAADPSVRIVGVDGAQRQVKLGDDIFADDTIKTDGKGKAQLMFEDRSTITVNENSEIKIDHFIYDPNTDAGEMGMKSVKGAFRFIGGALSKQKPVTIKTPVATIGIRGGIVDTSVAPNGATNAVFVYGKEMSITNGMGQTSITTDYGTGFTLNGINMPPVPMPPAAVQTVMNGFVTVASGGGGATVTPTSQSVSPQLNLGTGERTPEPLGAGNGGTAPANPEAGAGVAPASVNGSAANATATNGTQAPAPIVMVDSTSISAMDMGMLANNMASQNNDAMMQQAVKDPNAMQAMMSEKSLQTQLANNPELRDFLGTAPNTPAITPPPTPPAAPVAPITNTTTPVPTAIAPVAGGGGGTAAAPEVFTAVTGRAGKFMVLSDTVAGGGYEILNRGEITVTEESATNYRVTLTSAIAQPTRSFLIPKLTATGLTLGGSVALSEGGNTTLFDRDGYKTQSGAMEIYALRKSGSAANAPDREINFVTGQNIFNHGASTDPVKFNEAAARSVTGSSTAGTAVHGAVTNGVLLYDFSPELGTGDKNQFGNFNYNRIAGVTDSDALPTAQHTQAGLAVDWNSGRQGNAFSGQVNWLPVGGKSSATGSFGRKDGAISSTNTENIAGKRLAYTAESVGTSSSGAGTTNLSAFAIGNDLYSTSSGVVEGGVLRYATPTTPNPSNTANALLATSDAGLVNKGTQAIALKGAINDALAAQVATPNTSATYQGFASGVVMRHNGTIYEPVVYSNKANETNNVAINPTGTGSVTGTILTKNYNTDGTGGTAPITASFGGSDNNVYINRNMYTAQSTSISHNGTTPANQHGSFVVGAGALNNATDSLPNDYRCTNCQFTHWGVWAGDIGKNNAGRPQEDKANMIPYVVGNITQNAGSLATSTATYKGAAYATVHKGGINPRNIVGKMDATAALGGTPSITSFKLDFGSVEGEDLKLAKTAATIPIATSGNATFTGILEGDLGAPISSGRVNGALFGANAEEIGGNYVFERTTDDLQGGGIFLGKQP